MSEFSAKTLDDFSKCKIVVLGDLVADQFLHGTIARVSREAPVFILRHDNTETLPGGAANAAANVAALGGRALAVGLAGNDPNGAALVEKLRVSGVDCDSVVVSGTVKTTTKVRVLAGHHYGARQQVIRIDYENAGGIGAELQSALKKKLIEAAAGADAIIVSDYGYGAANPEMAQAARRVAAEKNIPLLIDSRFRLEEFAGATAATPNEDETRQILEKHFPGAEDFETGCCKLREKLGLEALLVTRGNRGMILFEKNKTPQVIGAVGSLVPVDVTGAGDTVMAAFGLGLASGATFGAAARLANHAGGIVVMKKGTATVSPSEILASIKTENGAKAGKQ